MDFDWRQTISINLAMLKSVGLWPKDLYKLDLYLLYSILATVLITGCHNLSQIINILYVYRNLELLTATIFVAAANTFSVVKRYYFIRNLDAIKTLFDTLNSGRFLPRTVKHKALVEVAVKEWKKAYVIFSIVAYTNVALWAILPYLTKDLPFVAWYPFDTHQSPNYEIVYCYQFICIWYIVISNLNLDTLVYAFMMFIGIQCDILAEELRNLEGEMFGDNLVECVKHHKEIIRFAKKYNKIFNIILFGQIATSTAALALGMFQLSVVDVASGDAISNLSFISGMTVEIFFYCWFGNQVEVKSNEIPYAIFQSKWLDQPGKNIKSMIILCERSRRPIEIKGLDLFRFSLQTFLSIFRTAWSYFAVLSTVNDK